MSGRLIPWGHSGNQPPAYGARNTGADLWSLPSQSILSDPSFPIPDLSQPVFNVGAFIRDFLLVVVTGLGLGASFFWLFFL
jgi:hypothetical protein